VALHAVQDHQHDDGQRHHVVRQRRRGHFQALDRAQHRDRRRDHAVAVEHGGAEDADDHQRITPARVARDRVQRERHQGHDAALAAVVGAQHQGHVFQRHDHRQAPEDQGHDAEQVGRSQRQAVGGVEDGLECVQRARADVAVDDADRSQGQRRKAAFLMFRRQVVTVSCFGALHNRIIGKERQASLSAEFCIFSKFLH
jgi:hypothetical protein